jgi:ribosome-binding factor A
MKMHRLARVSEAIRETASETILYDMNDPRIKLVTVTRAEVSGDLQHAKVYVSIMGTEKEQQLTLRGLRHATGFVQSKLAKRLQTRYTPVIQFVLDEGVKKSIELSRLLAAELGNGRTQTDEATDENTTDDESLAQELPEGTAGAAEEDHKEP